MFGITAKYLNQFFYAYQLNLINLCFVFIIKKIKATMLKKSKNKLKRRNTEPSVNSLQENNPSGTNQKSETDSFLEPEGESGTF